MAHPHEMLLQEFRNSVVNLVPLTPPEVIAEARQIEQELSANENASLEQIRQALVYVGQKEFPYRKAYEELCAKDEEARMQEIVLGKLDDDVKTKIEAVTKYGVHILDFVKSSQFDDLESSDRAAIDTAIVEAHDQLNRQCDERATSRKVTYDELVAQWRATEEKIQGMIEVLKGMAERDPKWHDDIMGRARQFEEGWSVVEEDPTEEEVQKEITYWAGVLGEGEEEEVNE
jgi:hypothetical protein